jgi:hypothetical protein
MKKEKRNQNKNSKSRKNKKKSRKKRKTHLRRVNGPAQRRAHAGGAEFRPANGRSIGISHNAYLRRWQPRNGPSDVKLFARPISRRRKRSKAHRPRPIQQVCKRKQKGIEEASLNQSVIHPSG